MENKGAEKTSVPFLYLPIAISGFFRYNGVKSFLRS